MLSDAATLTELDPGLVAPGVLPSLWQNSPLTLVDLSNYFSGTHFVPIDKSGYTENLLIPSVSDDGLRVAVTAAVKQGRLWLVNGTISVLDEEVPAGFVNPQASLFAPPPPIAVSDLLPAQLASAWTDNQSTAYLIHASLSANAGKPLPWVRVRQTLDEAFRLGLIERTLESASWPCDMGGAGAVKIRFRKGDSGIEHTRTTTYGAKVGSAELETHEIQELADRIDELRQATAGHKLRMRVTLEIGEAGDVSKELTDAVNSVLGKVKQGWTLH